MSRIRNKGTKPEVTLRKALFARGFRYRVNVKTLPGKPDIVLPRYKTVLFRSWMFLARTSRLQICIHPKEQYGILG